MRTNKMNPNYVGIFVVGVFLLALLILKNTLLASFDINYPAVICLALVFMTLIVSLIVVPKGEKSFLLPKALGYGWSINPRNWFGLLFYLVFVGVLLRAIV